MKKNSEKLKIKVGADWNKKISLIWVLGLLILQLSFYPIYKETQSQIITLRMFTQLSVVIIGLFGIGELVACRMLNKENFIKLNAMYTGALTIIFTVITSVLISAISKTFRFDYFLFYLITENKMSHVPVYTYFSMIFVEVCTLLALMIPEKYFGKLKNDKRLLLILVVYFIIISIPYL